MGTFLAIIQIKKTSVLALASSYLLCLIRSELTQQQHVTTCHGLKVLLHIIITCSAQTPSTFISCIIYWQLIRDCLKYFLVDNFEWLLGTLSLIVAITSSFRQTNITGQLSV